MLVDFSFQIDGGKIQMQSVSGHSSCKPLLSSLMRGNKLKSRKLRVRRDGDVKHFYHITYNGKRIGLFSGCCEFDAAQKALCDSFGLNFQVSKRGEKNHVQHETD